MSEPEDLTKYNQPQLIKLCKWDEDGMKCKNDAVKDGYCENHSKLSEKAAMGAIAGSGIGLTITNPVVLVVGAIAGACLAAYLYKKGKL